MEFVRNGIAIVYGKENPYRKHEPKRTRLRVRLITSADYGNQRDGNYKSFTIFTTGNMTTNYFMIISTISIS